MPLNRIDTPGTHSSHGTKMINYRRVRQMTLTALTLTAIPTSADCTPTQGESWCKPPVPLAYPSADVSAAFGWSVDFSADRAVIGAYLDDQHPGTPKTAPKNEGAAYVYSRLPDGSWSLDGKLPSGPLRTDDNFGVSVAISGETIVVGTFSDEDDSEDVGFNSGSVSVFDKSITDDWSLSQVLTDTTPTMSAGFGWSVDLDGNTAAVGSWYFGQAPGSVHLFTRDSGVWTEQAKLFSPSSPAAQDSFGYAVSLVGDQLVVGAPGTWTAGVPGFSGDGSVHVYKRKAENWALEATIPGSPSTSGLAFGASVDAVPGHLIAGAPCSSVSCSSAGIAEIYDFVSSADSWELAGTLNSPATLPPTAAFGGSVALSTNWSAVGAPREESQGIPESGRAYLFANCSGSWNQVASLDPPSPTQSERFGRALALDTDSLLIGATAAIPDVPLGNAYQVSLPYSCSEVSTRAGTPPNPVTFNAIADTTPAIGTIWSATVDHTSFEPQATLDFILIGTTQLNFEIASLGTLLCAPEGVFEIISISAGGVVAIPIPSSCGLIGLSICTQAISLDSTGSGSFTNALDLVIGVL